MERVLTRIRCGDLRRPRLVRPGFPRDHEAILECAMARDPQRRYLSCRAFAEDLESFADGRSVAARPVGFGERLGRPLRRHRGAVVGLTATGGLLLGSGATRAREVLEEALKIADHPRAESAERTTLATNYQLARDPVRSRAEMIKAA